MFVAQRVLFNDHIGFSGANYDNGTENEAILSDNSGLPVFCRETVIYVQSSRVDPDKIFARMLNCLPITATFSDVSPQAVVDFANRELNMRKPDGFDKIKAANFVGEKKLIKTKFDPIWNLGCLNSMIDLPEIKSKGSILYAFAEPEYVGVVVSYRPKKKDTGIAIINPHSILKIQLFRVTEDQR